MGVMPTLPAIRRMLTASGPSFSSTRNAQRAIRCSVFVCSAMPIHCIPSWYTVYTSFLFGGLKKSSGALAVSNRAPALEYHRLTVQQVLAPKDATESLAQACALP
jgi:hypothetical protein